MNKRKATENNSISPEKVPKPDEEPDFRKNNIAYNNEETITNAKLYECDLDLLAKQYEMNWMEESYRLDDTELKSADPNAKPKPKPYRTSHPSKEIQEEMRDVEQNSKPWHGFRAGSAGGSGLACLLGWDSAGYMDNVLLFFLESGRFFKALAKSVLDLYFMKHGHRFESEAVRIYSVLMGVKVYIVGMLLHWACCFVHISPDGLAEYFPGIFHNKYAMRDSRRGNVEIKNPIFHAYETLNGIHNVPTHYMIQIMMQMYVFLTAWVDFVVCWRAQEKCQPVDVSDKKGAGCFLVGESLVTRVYRSNKFGEKLIFYLRQFMMHLKKKDVFLDYVDDSQFIYTIPPPKTNEQVWIYYRFDSSEKATDQIQLSKNDYELEEKTGKLRILFDKNNQYGELRFPGNAESTNNKKFFSAKKVELQIVYPPKTMDKADLPVCVILPLKKVYWYLYCEPGASPYNPKTNRLEGLLKPEVHHYWDQKPLQVSMNDLLTKNETLKELDAVPDEDPMPSSFQVTNPMWKDLIKQNPSKRLCDIIWEFATAKECIEQINT